MPNLRLILWPAIVTFAVALLRLTGELLQWSPRLFSRAAGGAAALVGIIWLVPIFGVYLSIRLCAVVPSPVGQLAILAIASWLALAIARPGWPALWRLLLAYAVSARLPVLVIMFASIFGGLDTHYPKPRPDSPAMGPAGLFFWTALLPQLSVWIYLTVVGGLIAGALAAFFVDKTPVARPWPSSG